ncbi:MAG: hypothetical protein Q8Q09_06765 [Deltaproteobacteria bacterium]|nr:hypothetical protein [Deltaproteobacteria bacterium]
MKPLGALPLLFALAACASPSQPTDTALQDSATPSDDVAEDTLPPPMDAQAQDSAVEMDASTADVTEPEAAVEAAVEASAGLCSGSADCEVFCQRMTARCAMGAMCSVNGADQCPRWATNCETLCGIGLNVLEDYDIVRAVNATPTCAEAQTRFQMCSSFATRCPEPQETLCDLRCGGRSRRSCAMGAACNIAVAPMEPNDFCETIEGACTTTCQLASGRGGRGGMAWECAARASNCAALVDCINRCAPRE